MGTPNTHATVHLHLDEPLHRALRRQAAETGSTISELVEDILRHALAEEAADLAAFENRAHEPDLPFEDVARELRRRGHI